MNVVCSLILRIVTMFLQKKATSIIYYAVIAVCTWGLIHQIFKIKNNPQGDQVKSSQKQTYL